jgi:hypothetical protein
MADVGFTKNLSSIRLDEAGKSSTRMALHLEKIDRIYLTTAKMMLLTVAIATLIPIIFLSILRRIGRCRSPARGP